LSEDARTKIAGIVAILMTLLLRKALTLFWLNVTLHPHLLTLSIFMQVLWPKFFFEKTRLFPKKSWEPASFLIIKYFIPLKRMISFSTEM